MGAQKKKAAPDTKVACEKVSSWLVISDPARSASSDGVLINAQYALLQCTMSFFDILLRAG